MSACVYMFACICVCACVCARAFVLLHKGFACHFCGLLVFCFSAHAAFSFGWGCRVYFVNSILLLTCRLGLISMAVGNGKAMPLAATAAALKTKAQPNDIKNTPIKQSHCTRPCQSYSLKTLIKCPLWGLNP